MDFYKYSYTSFGFLFLVKCYFQNLLFMSLYQILLLINRLYTNRTPLHLHPLQGAFWSLVAGLVAGLTRMIMDFAYGAPLCGQEEYRPAILYKVGREK